VKGVPPEIDALMWQLAENGGPVAQAEFEARHTRYAPELSRRIHMVAELREAGKTVVPRPTFTPRPARVAPTPRWAVGAVAGLAVLAVGAVAYVAASGNERRQASPVPAPRSVPAVDVGTVTVPQPEVVVKEPAPVEPPLSTVEPRTAEPKAEKRPKYLDPRDTHIAETSLVAAIKLVAAGGGLEATLAPGFVDRTVSVDYGGLNTIDTLKAMGEEHGFSVLEEGEGQVLLIPVRENPDPSRRVGP